MSYLKMNPLQVPGQAHMRGGILRCLLKIGVGLCLARDGPMCVSSEVLRPIVPERVGAGRATLSTEPDERCHFEDTYLRGSHDVTASRDVTHGCSRSLPTRTYGSIYLLI